MPGLYGGGDSLFRRQLRDSLMSNLNKKMSRGVGLQSGTRGGGQFTLKPTEMITSDFGDQNAFNQRYANRMQYGDRWNRGNGGLMGLETAKMGNERAIQGLRNTGAANVAGVTAKGRLEEQGLRNKGALDERGLITQQRNREADLRYGPGDPVYGIPPGPERIKANASLINAQRNSRTRLKAPGFENVKQIINGEESEIPIVWNPEIGRYEIFQIPNPQPEPQSQNKKGRMTGTGSSNDPYHYSNY